METTHVVTCFLEHQGKILLLRRSGQVGSYRQKWAGISGYVEESNTPLNQAWQELEEETSLSGDDLRLLKEGATLEVIDADLGKNWIVHPFRFYLEQPDKLRIDWEHSEYRWIIARDLQGYDTVPGLWEAWIRVQ